VRGSLRQGDPGGYAANLRLATTPHQPELACRTRIKIERHLP